MRTYQAQTYSIGNVAKMTGATKKQIRNWEASGHIPKRIGFNTVIVPIAVSV